MALIVGLGNPGPRYRGTRHNAGFFVLDELARRWGVEFSEDRLALRARYGDVRLLKPTTFMNLSGRAVQAEMAKHSISPADLIVVHDDLDLPLGRLRIKQGGGAGGQKGIKDITERIGAEFTRVKVGIDRPPERWTVENWVLSRFAPDERDLVADVVDLAADAVEAILAESAVEAMNRFNARDLRPSESSGADSEDERDGDDPPSGSAQPNRPEM